MDTFHVGELCHIVGKSMYSEDTHRWKLLKTRNTAQTNILSPSCRSFPLNKASLGEPARRHKLRDVYIEVAAEYEYQIGRTLRP